MALDSTKTNEDQAAQGIGHVTRAQIAITVERPVCRKPSGSSWAPAVCMIGRVSLFTIALVSAIASASLLPGAGQSVRIFFEAVFG
jgi:hypothetical protein